ncbi:alpha/beta fold hydrolase [Chelativorans salis]|uniref:Alpha/beta hydrolase n=1 Tax=Chelativorans salis TaxID=2978478 RepID=A0ABT2LK62_9HYPH|nr:alpha/beta hydrolase [Chelativorans sp. EGI FJ00035]MCT7374981.1 alpha/beta hydrolase [Chelativorans sp. EGI FJ00035]
MPFDDQRELAAPSGAVLNLYIRHCNPPAKGVVQINHGLAEHAARYARFADFLAAHGFHIYAHDHRGHGHTKAPDAPLGTFGQEPAAENVIADVLAVHERIATDHPGLPVILFGHSMGAMIALAFLMRHASRVRAAALWNAPLANRLEARAAKAVLAWERFRLGSDVPSQLIPRLTFQAWITAIPDARTPFDWLSRDAEEVEKCIADPLCGWLPTVAMWRAVFDFNLMIAGGDFSAVPKGLPVQLVGGGADPSTKGGETVRRLEARLRREGFSNLETIIYPEIRHESLNELNREVIMGDFAQWATGALAGA